MLCYLVVAENRKLNVELERARNELRVSLCAAENLACALRIYVYAAFEGPAFHYPGNLKVIIIRLYDLDYNLIAVVSR